MTSKREFIPLETLVAAEHLKRADSFVLRDKVQVQNCVVLYNRNFGKMES